MTKEQEEILERLEKKLKEPKNITLLDNKLDLYGIRPKEYNDKDIEAVLNMIKDLKRENKTLTQTNRSYKGMINKKDKQIDLIAKYLAINGVERDICNEKRIKENCKNVTVDNITVHRCKECIKQYFERKSKNEN